MSKEIFDTFKFKCGAELKNRVLMAPMTIQAGYFDGSVTSEMIDYYPVSYTHLTLPTILRV